MATRRDQLHSYQFMIQRVVAALVMRETDPAQSPFRRAAGAIFAGFMVAAIGVAGFMVYGLWKPGGNSSWITAGAKKPVVLVVRETGAKYVYDGRRLLPAINYTSALLAVGAVGGNPQPIEVSRNSLATEAAGIARGPMIGIPDAPDSLPSKDNLVVGDWSLCTQPKTDIQGAAKGLETVMVVGETPYDKQVLGGVGVLLVEDEETTDKYLIYHGHKFKIVGEDVVLRALTWSEQTPLKVGAAWLTSMPEGQEIAKPSIAGEGEPSSALPDATIGEVFQVGGVAEHPYYVALKDKLAKITEMQAAIQMTGREQGNPKEIISSNVGTPSTELLPKPGDGAPPESAHPDLHQPKPTMATCAVFGADGKAPVVMINGILGIAPDQGAETAQRGEQGERLASRVVVPTGKGAIIMTSKTLEDGSMRLCLVTDSGKYYVLTSQDVLKMLGYDPQKPEIAEKIGWMPENLVARLPRGAALDPEDAMLPVG